MDSLRYWYVTLNAFDGHQHGMMTLCVRAYTQERAEYEMVKLAKDDGWEQVKVLFTRTE